MRQRFTVIDGGAGRREVDVAEAISLAGPASWRIELFAPGAVPEERIAAWRGLIARLRVSDPVRSDPDLVLPTAQHLSRAGDPVFAFALAKGDGHERLDGVIGLTMPHSLLGRPRARLWHPPGEIVAPLVDPQHAAPIRTALEDELHGAGIRVGLDIEESASAPSRFERMLMPMRAIRPPFRPRRGVPPDNMLGVRPVSAPASEPPRTERIVEPDLIRDAVEDFLVLDARVSPRPILADPSEAAMVRVVTRLFGQRRQVTVEIVRRADRVIAGRVRLGHGPNAILWRHAEDRRAATRHDANPGRGIG